MCGIVGFIGSFEKEKLQLGLDKIRHRGPDGQGTFFHHDAALGHRRLSIIDLSENAKQPMEVLDRYAITFNGEIYNYIELKKELSASGFTFRSDSDTEVLLYAYVKWGKEFVHRLNGMWAFAIYDKTEGSLFLSRDRMGKKPLFYAQLKDGFVFSSEMKGIYPFLDQVAVDHDHAMLAVNNCFGYEHTDMCLIGGIKRFPAASNGFYNKGSLRLETYWRVEDTKRPVPERYEEQTELFRELFLDACKIRMRSDVTLGTALSGGLDSSAVICAMAHIQKHAGSESLAGNHWQHAFVASFPGTKLDETKYAKAVTDYLGIGVNFVNIDPLKDLDSIFEKTYLFEEIFYAPVIPFVQLYENIRQNKVTVSIDGHGADELFAGYPFDMDSALIDTLPNVVKFKKVLEAINNSSGHAKSKDFNNKLKYALLNKYPYLRKFSNNAHLTPKKEHYDHLNSTLHQSAFKTVLPTLLRNYDRYAMMNSVEIRMPFLDYRIVEFAFSIPYSSKIRNGFGKAIVRDALEDIMPKEIVRRKDKIGFNAPVNNWMNTELKSWINELIHSDDFKHSQLIDPKKTYELIHQAISQKDINFMDGTRIFEQLIPVIWEKSLRYA
jgi:asparagine synthase (glutamine-hydrolysing)